ncbi:MAG: hypothetical protein E7Z87_05670 [Cyanobacteria bacterium SIG26]|nr:hypothetical protein [Cyanobacteria bacterium SIG26]
MKKILKITGYVLLSIFGLLYLSFLLLVPNLININDYKSDIQKLVKDNTNLTVDFEEIKVITTPILEAGVKAKNISVKLPDNTILFSSESFKGKVFLPSLLLLSIRVTCAEIQNPYLNIEITNGEKYKLAKVYEDIINKQREEKRLHPPVAETQNSPLDISSIKIFVPSLKLNNYKAVINDLQTDHKLTLLGNELKLGYFNGKIAKLKTDAKLLSDESTNIIANIDINTFIPELTPQPQEEIDNEEKFELPFINPVSVYRDYNLKSNISAKLKLRQKKDKKIWAKGFANIDNTTVTLLGKELPESYFALLAKGQITDIDTVLYATDKEYIHLISSIGYGKEPFIDLTVKSPQVYFNNLLNITKAYLDTAHIKNDIANMSADGYLLSNFRLKTDFKEIESEGKFVVRNGNIYHKNIGLVFNDINANLLFDDNIFKIIDTHLLINKQPLKISGEIDNHSIANFDVDAQDIPIRGLYRAFAPREIKNAYSLHNGLLTLKAKLTGEIKDIASLCRIQLKDLYFTDKAHKLIISNKSLRFGLASMNGLLRGKLQNDGFSLRIPEVNSTLTNPKLIITLDNNDIVINDSNFNINKNSTITFSGQIVDYLKNPDTIIKAEGHLADYDLKTLIGTQAAPYLDSIGNIPLKATFEANGKKAKFVTQLLASADSYITPIKINKIVGNQLLAQVWIELNNDVLKIKKTGLYMRKPNTPFVSGNLRKNLLNAEEIISTRAIISNLTTIPFINLLKIRIPKELDGSICIFDKSHFLLGGNLYAFGKVKSPTINGNFYIRDLTIPEIYTSVRDTNLDLASNDMKLRIADINANGSDFNINVNSTWEQLSKMNIETVKILSNSINLDKLMKVTEELTKQLPIAPTTASNSTPADIPIQLLDGNIQFKDIQTGGINVKNTTGKISLIKNIFYLNDLKTYPMGGYSAGDISMNLITNELNAKITGKDYNMERVMLDAMQMKDMLAGNMNFIADISMTGLTQEEQMNSLNGYVDFNIKDGQLGPFGRFENFLMAENLRENAFFSSTIGAVIKNIVTIDTSHFNDLYGHLTFEDGFANIAPIKSQGNVMSLYIAGKVGLLDSSADMKLRGKLASMFSDNLGPLANINPVNLIKNTPGLNIVAAKTFALFCEEISEEEMKALPQLGDGKTDDYATKFQIVLKGDTRKPLKMIKSFKWLALDSEIETAQNFVDTIPIPQPGEENLSVEELIQLRAEQAAAEQAAIEAQKSWFTKWKEKRNKQQ